MSEIIFWIAVSVMVYLTIGVLIVLLGLGMAIYDEGLVLVKDIEWRIVPIMVFFWPLVFLLLL